MKRGEEPQPRIGIALLNWNQYGDTARCLQALRSSIFPPAAVVVFDNGSQDGSANKLQAEFPEIQLVRGGGNLGFAEANNRAAGVLLAQGMDFVWILNNDTAVEPGCLGALVRALQADPELGAVGAKIWFMDGRRTLGYAGATFNRWTFNSGFRGLGRPDAGQYEQAADTAILTGCCMLIRSEVLRRLGLFNRGFFAYAEDVDWSLRARAAGLRLGYEPRAILRHRMFGASRKEGDTVPPKSSPQVEYLLSRNRFILVRLHTRPGSPRRIFALGYHIFIRRLPRAAGLLLLRSRRAAGVAIVKGLWAGLWVRPDPGDCRV